MDTSCLTGLRVLVVEDEAIIAMANADVLRRHRCVVVGFAQTVRRALDMIAATRPDAVLLDADLHGQLSGPVAEELDARGIPYLLATGFVSLVLVDPVLARAPRIEKPFRADQLGAAMVRVFC